MNQKQRDYLIKRLQKVAEEKKSNFSIDPPDPIPFVKKLKTAIPGAVMNKLAKEFSATNRKEDGKYIKKTGRDRWVEGKRIIGLDIDHSCSIKDSDYYVNVDEIKEEYRKHCEHYYDVEDKRFEEIDLKCQALCDKVQFAETYDDAVKMIEEFNKF